MKPYNTIYLNSTLVMPNVIRYDVKVPGEISKYLSKRSFYVIYNYGIEEADPAIISIPGVGILLPLALATGNDIVVETCDDTFLKSIEKLKNVIKDMYPQLPTSTCIYSKSLKHVCIRGDDKAIFFSMGVDSTAMLLRHIDEKTWTVTVWGSDIPLENIQKWSIVKTYVKKHCKKVRCKGNIFIVFENPLNTGILEDDFVNELKGNDWWGGLQAGITLPLLVAPVVESNGIKTVYIASGIPANFKFSWSDRPEIYNAVAFANVKVICDDFEMSRMDKIRIIKEKGFPGLKLRVCLNSSAKKLNCGTCAKCVRTIASLIVAGLDPNELGFNIDLSDYLQHVMKMLRRPLSPTDVYFWVEIIREARKQRKAFAKGVTNNIIEILANISLKHQSSYKHSMPLHTLIRRKIMRIYYSLPIVLREKVDPRLHRRTRLLEYFLKNSKHIL